MKVRNNFGYPLIAGAVIALSVSAGISTPAEAGAGRKGVYTQDYQFTAPAHGFEGRTWGGYYCSYQRLPNRVCKWKNGKESCKIKGWTLRQRCY